MADKSASGTVTTFLSRLPPPVRTEVKRVREVLRSRMPKGYEEVVSGDSLVYQVPLKRYPDTYNGQPLRYVWLSPGKSRLSLHVMPVYGDPAQARRLQEGFRAEGKKLDMGKACIHFKRADDLALDVIGEIVESTPVDRWVEIAQGARRR